MEGYPDCSGEDKQTSSSMDDIMLRCPVKTNEGVLIAAGQKKWRAPEDRMVRKNKMGSGSDQHNFCLRAHSS